MNVTRIHQYHGAGADLELVLAMEIQALPGSDRADGKVFVGVAGVADLAAVGDGPRLDERQVVVAPEQRFT